MKLSGDLIGITLKENNRMRLFFIVPELSQLAEDAETMAAFQGNVRQHHELFLSLTEHQNKQADQLLMVTVTLDREGFICLISHIFMPDCK